MYELKEIFDVEKEFSELSKTCCIQKKCDCERFNLIDRRIQNIKLVPNHTNRDFYFNTVKSISKSIDGLRTTCAMINSKDRNSELNGKFRLFQKTNILYIDNNPQKSITMNRLLSRFFENVEILNDFKTLFNPSFQLNFKVVMIDFNSFNLSKIETLKILEKLLQKDVIVYVFCNTCKNCEYKECSEVVKTKNVRYFEIPFDFNDLLNILSLDLEITEFDLNFGR